MNKKYTALLCAIIVVWVGAFGLYGGKRYADAVKQMMGMISFKPGYSAALTVVRPVEQTTNAEKSQESKKAAKKNEKAEKKSSKKTEEKSENSSKKAEKATKKASEKKESTAAGISKKTEKKTNKASGKSENAKKQTEEATTVSAQQKKKKSETIKQLNSVIASLQKSKKQFCITEAKNIALEVKKCSVDGLLPAVQNIVQSYAVEEETVYNFKDGIATDSVGNTLSVSDVILPKYSTFTAAEYNVLEAEKHSVKKGTELALTINRETVVSDGVPFNHASTVGYIDFSKLDLSPLSVSELKVVYKTAEYKAVIDKNGKLISINTRTPVVIYITGDMGTDVELKVTGTIRYNLKIEY